MDSKVRDVMTPDPIGVSYDQTVAEAARAMRDAGIGAVLVVNGEELCGVVTDRDLIVRAVADSMGPDQAVGPLCTPDLIGVNAEDNTKEALRLMRENAVRRLPVIDDGQIAGMVSLGDIAREHDSGSALADVSKAKPNL